MKTQIKRFLLTLGFMTRIPVNVDLGEVKDEDMHKGFLYYPVVGLILGLCDMVFRILPMESIRRERERGCLKL